MKFFKSMLTIAILTSSAQAGSVSLPRLADPDPVTVLISTATMGTEEVYADPFLSGGGAIQAGTIAYCVDLDHVNTVPTSYQVMPSPTLNDPTFTPSINASNEIGYVLSIAHPDVYSRAAAQLAIWYAVDNTLVYSYVGPSGGAAAVAADYLGLIDAFPTLTGIYSAQFWIAGHQGNQFQDLVTVPGVPEPATGALLGIAVGIWFCVWRVMR